MQIDLNRKMWQAPWGYPESFAVVVGVILMGLLLQLVVGSFDFYLLAAPANYLVALLLVALSLLLGVRARQSHFARWITSIPLTVALISAMVVMTLIMGLTPQRVAPHTRLGFETMTTCWAFVWLYGLLLLSLGGVIVRRMRRFKVGDTPFYLNHLGLWLLLMAAGLGYADMERYIIHVNEGETEWRVYDAEQQIKELPIAITLHDFNMEFYPSRQVIVDVESGKVQQGDPAKYPLGERYRAVMSVPEPKCFRSEVTVYTQRGEQVEQTIEVNKPLRIGAWRVYQYGYDHTAGERSSYSSFELVYDAWILPVYIGIIMMMVGAVTMLWSGRHVAKRGGIV